jgi:hypothetical protein
MRCSWRRAFAWLTRLKLIAKYQDVVRGVDAHAHLVAGDFDDRNHDGIAKTNPLRFFSRKDKHSKTSGALAGG